MPTKGLPLGCVVTDSLESRWTRRTRSQCHDKGSRSNVAPHSSGTRRSAGEQQRSDDQTILGHTIMGLAGLSRALVAR